MMILLMYALIQKSLNCPDSGTMKFPICNMKEVCDRDFVNKLVVHIWFLNNDIFDTDIKRGNPEAKAITTHY